MLDKILAKLKEASTWRGIIMLLGLAGVTLSPELTEAIVYTGLAAMGLVEVVRKEHPAKVEEEKK